MDVAVVMLFIWSLFVVVFSMIFLYKNNRTHNIRIEILDMDRKDFVPGIDDPKVFKRYDLLPSYDGMLWNFRRWTLKSWLDYIEEKGSNLEKYQD